MKFLLKTCFISVVFGMSCTAYALKGDTNQPINIDSGSQSLDLQNNIVTLSDGVVIKQGSILIKANHVVITRPQKAGQKEKIAARGMPVTFSQKLDDGRIVDGQGNQANYDLNQEFLTLTGNAKLKQRDSFISAPTITYDVKKQQLKAISGGKSRVRTVLIPNQLNKKN